MLLCVKHAKCIRCVHIDRVFRISLPSFHVWLGELRLRLTTWTSKPARLSFTIVLSSKFDHKRSVEPDIRECACDIAFTEEIRRFVGSCEVARVTRIPASHSHAFCELNQLWPTLPRATPAALTRSKSRPRTQTTAPPSAEPPRRLRPLGISGFPSQS